MQTMTLVQIIVHVSRLIVVDTLSIVLCYTNNHHMPENYDNAEYEIVKGDY